jgi:hypothetical protein
MVYSLTAKVYDLPAICFAIKSWTPRERSPFLVYDLAAIDTCRRFSRFFRNSRNHHARRPIDPQKVLRIFYGPDPQR